ncbi:MAG TPA: coiled-coil domain-containing protein [Solirubrobacterales bacterium]|nr:coiled-coil domain-containing protein [Solirubrobacterales bacterium]
MAVMAREAWTDERLDDLKQAVEGMDRRMEAGFAEMRSEFKAVRSEIRNEFKAVRSEIRSEIKAVRNEIRGEFKAVRNEIRGEFKTVRSEIRGEFQAVRGEIRGEFQGVRGEMKEIRTEIGALNRTVIQFAWSVVGTMFLGFMGTIAALVTLA